MGCDRRRRRARGGGYDIQKITETAARCFFNQAFRDGFFHADMHLGNIFIAPDGMLVPTDFGIMGISTSPTGCSWRGF